LEQEAKAKEIAVSQEIQDAVFDAMKIGEDDRKLLDAIVDSRRTCAPVTLPLPKLRSAYDRADQRVIGWVTAILLATARGPSESPRRRRS
jgi:hypothetical protein